MNSTRAYQAGVTALLFFATFGVACAQMFTPYDYFRSLTVEEKDTFQLKLTWVGGGSAPGPVAILHATAEPADLSQFMEFRRSGIDYELEEIVGLWKAAVSRTDIDSIISAIGTLPTVIDGGASPDVADQQLSISLLVRQPTKRAFESVLTYDELVPLFDALRPALATSDRTRRLVRRYACVVGGVRYEPPIDVTSSTKVTLSGVRREANSDRFVGSATIKNISSETLAGPITLVVRDLGLVELENVTDTTCQIFPGGSPFIDVNRSLAAGEELTISLAFRNHYLQTFSPTTAVFAGPGER